MVRLFAKIALCLAVMLAAGSAPCLTATAFKTGCFLQDYNRLGHIGGVPIEQVWLHPEFDIRAYRTLYIAPVQIDPVALRHGGQADHQMAQNLAVALRNELTCQLQGAGIFTVVSNDPAFMNYRQGGLTLQLRITEIASGNAAARTFIGLGAGATQVQLEGKIFDSATRVTFAEFADRRLHPGSTLLMGASATGDAEYLIGIDLKQMSRAVVKLFIYTREEGPLGTQPF